MLPPLSMPSLYEQAADVLALRASDPRPYVADWLPYGDALEYPASAVGEAYDRFRLTIVDNVAWDWTAQDIAAEAEAKLRVELAGK